jgi:hypothetical protein
MIGRLCRKKMPNVNTKETNKPIEDDRNGKTSVLSYEETKKPPGFFVCTSSRLNVLRRPPFGAVA